MESIPNFVPQLAISSGVTDLDFYKKAFDAVEQWRLNNDDGSVHVASFSIADATFHLHEESPKSGVYSPGKHNSTTVTIGLMVDDPHAVAAQAIAAGARVIHPVQDYEYGYRQGTIADPFGHQWLIEKIIDKEAITSFISNAK